jgi:hypothetical protein
MTRLKKMPLIITFIGLYCHVLAQGNRSQASATLDKFVGTWVYNKDGKEIKIILNKIKKRVNLKDVYIDVIEGYHSFKVNNKNIENYQGSNKMSLSMGYIQEREKPDRLLITVSDSIKNKTGIALITFIPGNPDKIRWGLRNNREFIIHKPGEREFDKTFTLPESLILEREK